MMRLRMEVENIMIIVVLVSGSTIITRTITICVISLTLLVHVALMSPHLHHREVATIDIMNTIGIDVLLLPFLYLTVHQGMIVKDIVSHFQISANATPNMLEMSGREAAGSARRHADSQPPSALVEEPKERNQKASVTPKDKDSHGHRHRNSRYASPGKSRPESQSTPYRDRGRSRGDSGRRPRGRGQAHYSAPSRCRRGIPQPQTNQSPQIPGPGTITELDGFRYLDGTDVWCYKHHIFGHKSTATCTDISTRWDDLSEPFGWRFVAGNLYAGLLPQLPAQVVTIPQCATLLQYHYDLVMPGFRTFCGSRDHAQYNLYQDLVAAKLGQEHLDKWSQFAAISKSITFVAALEWRRAIFSVQRQFVTTGIAGKAPRRMPEGPGGSRIPVRSAERAKAAYEVLVELSNTGTIHTLKLNAQSSLVERLHVVTDFLDSETQHTSQDMATYMLRSEAIRHNTIAVNGFRTIIRHLISAKPAANRYSIRELEYPIGI